MNEEEICEHGKVSGLSGTSGKAVHVQRSFRVQPIRRGASFFKRSENEY